MPRLMSCSISYTKLPSCMLKCWSKRLFSSAKIRLHVALQVILYLDTAQDNRPLSPEEADVRARLKRRVIGLAIIVRTRKKQCARVENLKEGDAIHLRVNAGRRKKLREEGKQLSTD